MKKQDNTIEAIEETVIPMTTEEIVSSVIAAGASLLTAEATVTKRNASLQHTVAWGIRNLMAHKDREESIAILRSELKKQDVEGSEKARGAISNAVYLVPFCLEYEAGVGMPKSKQFPTLDEARAVFRACMKEPSEAYEWSQMIADAKAALPEDVAQNLVDVQAAARKENKKLPESPPTSAWLKEIVKTFPPVKKGGGGGSSPSEITLPVVIAWAAKLAPEAFETLMVGLRKVKETASSEA